MSDIIEIGETYNDEQHWEVVAKGDIITFETPQDLFKAATNYFSWCDTHPIQIKRGIATGKDAGAKYVEEKIRPYTMSGLCLHLGIDENYFSDILKMNDKNSLWSIVINRIDNIIRTQTIEMSVVGEYNANVALKMLDEPISRKVSNDTIKVELVQGLPPLAKSETELLEND